MLTRLGVKTIYILILDPSSSSGLLQQQSYKSDTTLQCYRRDIWKVQEHFSQVAALTL